MSDDVQRTGPGEKQGPGPGNGHGTGPPEEQGTDLTRLEGLPTYRADPIIDEQVRLGWVVEAAGFVNRLTLEASAPSQGMVSLAMALAVVTAFGGGFAAALIAVGAPAVPSLIVGALPVLVFGIAALRQHAGRSADPKQILGRRRGTGTHDDSGDSAGREPDGTGGGATR